jgi:hypothetical protein
MLDNHKTPNTNDDFILYEILQKLNCDLEPSMEGYWLYRGMTVFSVRSTFFNFTILIDNNLFILMGNGVILQYLYLMCAVGW